VLYYYVCKVRSQLFAVRHNVQAVQVPAVQGRHMLHEGDSASQQGAARCTLCHEDLPQRMGHHLRRRRPQRSLILQICGKKM